MTRAALAGAERRSWTLDSGFDVQELIEESVLETETKMELTQLWSRVLEVDEIDPDDNFFLLGGDSLRAATLFAEIDATFGVMLPLETIYDEGETVAGMAALIDSLTAPSEPVSASEDDTPDDTPDLSGISAQREKLSSIPLAVGSDLTTALTLLSLATICWLPGSAARAALCRRIAGAHIAIRGSQANHLEDVIPRLPTYSSAKELERDQLAGGYEEMASALRDHLPQKNPPLARLIGRAHIDAALAAGRGAVLWNMPSAPGGRAGLRCLADARFPIAQLRSYAHPYSASRFGMKFLNPISNIIDNRYVKETAVLHDGNAIETMQQLGESLGQNMLVRLSANGSSGNPHEIPFLGGTLRLALGAPTLALLHGAPLIPTFCIPDGDGGFDLVAEAPLTEISSQPIGKRAEALAHDYAEMLACYVKRHPQLWRCWYMANTWRPDR